jgi:hypothetical protein
MGAAHYDALPLAGCGTSKDAGCIAIRGKRHRAVVRYVDAAFEFRAGLAGGSGGAVCEGGLSIRQIRGPDKSVPAAPGSFTQRPVNNSGWPRRAGLKIGSQKSPP